MSRSHQIAHVSEIPSPVPREAGSHDWKPIRHHFDVRSFGINAFVAPDAGDEVVEDHDEMGERAAQHEELYFVASGHARFTVAGEELDAPQGTIVFVPDPEARRSARALEPGTTVLAIGGKPGVAYDVSKWEHRYFEAPSTTG